MDKTMLYIPGGPDRRTLSAEGPRPPRAIPAIPNDFIARGANAMNIPRLSFRGEFCTLWTLFQFSQFQILVKNKTDFEN
jgi:hypothetical protein